MSAGAGAGVGGSGTEASMSIVPRPKYAAFISYRHRDCNLAHARSLESALRRCAKPLWRPPISLFRDDRVLKPGDDLPRAPFERRSSGPNSAVPGHEGHKDGVEQTLAWLRDLAAVHVVLDEPQGVGNCWRGVWEVANPDPAIVRLHGRNAETWNAKGLAASSDRFNYGYSVEELAELSGRIVNLADKAFAVQVLVNVNYEDQGIEAARRLERLLGRLPHPDSIGKPAGGAAAPEGETQDMFGPAPEPAPRPARKTRAPKPRPDKPAEPDEDPTAWLFWSLPENRAA